MYPDTKNFRNKSLPSQLVNELICFSITMLHRGYREIHTYVAGIFKVWSCRRCPKAAILHRLCYLKTIYDCIMKFLQPVCCTMRNPSFRTQASVIGASNTEGEKFIGTAVKSPLESLITTPELPRPAANQASIFTINFPSAGFFCPL